MNAVMMKFLYRVVAERLAHLRDSHQIIFTTDTCKCHITKDTLACCGRHKMWPHLIPAKMTWALQPLDTHVFSKFKSTLATTWQRLQVAQSTPSKVEWASMIKAVVQTTQDVLCGEPWVRAFNHTGVSGEMHLVSPHVLAKIGLSEAPVLETRLPSAAQLQAIFPSSYSDWRIDELFGAWTGRFKPRGDPPAPRPEWHGRLRSSSSSHPAVPPHAAYSRGRPQRVPVGRPLLPGLRRPE